MRPRIPLDTAIGCLATLTALIPLHALETAGVPETWAARVAGALLFAAAIAALAFRRAPSVQREYRIKGHSAPFRLPEALRAFGLFAFAELAVLAIILALLWANLP